MKINLNHVRLEQVVGNRSQFRAQARPQVALSGRSNVGKSSLINTLLGRKSLARVSSAPGKTVTLNYYNVDDRLYLVDLPGYGYARRSRESQKVWSALTEDYFLRNPSSDRIALVVQLVDVRTGPTEDDVLMMNWMTEQGIPFFVVFTKCDKLSGKQLAEALEKWRREYFEEAGIETIPFSSVTGDGRETLWNRILAAVSPSV